MKSVILALAALLSVSAICTAFTVSIPPVVPVVDDISDIIVIGGTDFKDWNFFGSSDRTLNTLDVGGSGYTPSMRLFISDGNRAASLSSYSNTTKKKLYVGSVNPLLSS